MSCCKIFKRPPAAAMPNNILVFVCPPRPRRGRKNKKLVTLMLCVLRERKEKQTLRNWRLLPASRRIFFALFLKITISRKKNSVEKNTIIIIIMKKQQPTNPHQYLKFNNRTECHIHHQAKGVSVFVSFFVL